MDTFVPTYTKKEEWSNTGTQQIMIFYPTMEEISNFSDLIRRIESQGAHLSSGIAKIVPPKGWRPRIKKPTDYSDVDSHIIEQPVYYWKNVTRHEPIYGADTPGTLFDDEVKEINANNLGTILDITKKNGPPIKGVTTVFLYFGMWKTTFPWHSEDMDLYSINILHFGEPKFWYAIPPHASEKFERLAAQRFPEDSRACRAFLRHKTFIISPSLLKTYSIPYGTMVQYPGEIIVTFPKGYHMGFNTGYNCAESTNFAIERWIDYGKNAVLCHCRADTVTIDMREYMRLYRPEECKEWEEYWYKISPTHKCGKDAISPKNIQNFTQARAKKIEKAKNGLKKLWSRLPCDLFSEKQFNEKCGLLYPHCAICQYFWPREVWFTNGKPLKSVPKSCNRYVTDQMFYKDKEIDKDVFEIEEDELLTCDNCKVVVHSRCYPYQPMHFKKAIEPKVDNDSFCPDEIKSEIEEPCFSSEQLLTSDRTNEYLNESELETPREIPIWLCARCNRSSDIAIRSAYCISCELRGGALIEFNEDGSFIHMICAIMNTKVKFHSPEQRTGPYFTSSNLNCSLNDDQKEIECQPDLEKPILSNPVSTVISPTKPTQTNQLISPNEVASPEHIYPSSSASLPTTYECEICGHQADFLIRCDVCVETEELGASLRFHITCAPLADVSFERRFSPIRTSIVCAFHNTPSALIDLRRIDVKQRVYVYSKEDSVVGRGRVRYITENVWATVDWLDGTVTKEVFSNEIKNCECRHLDCGGNHIPGSLVYVKWLDGLIYQGYYRNKVPVKKYNIELEATKESPRMCMEVSPDDVYRQDEALPEEIRRALLKRFNDWEVGIDSD